MATKKKKTKSVKSKATQPRRPKGSGSRPELRLKTSEKASGKNKLTTVSDGHCFWLHNGPALTNLKDLSGAFLKMTNDQFIYHANKTKNDFASWVEFVLLDPECGSNLRKCNNKASARACTLKALKKYS